MTRALHDARGAIMVLGLFMAVFAAGCLCYVVAIGEVIWQRERMQDAADTAAYASAVLHARGMNLIAFVNMTMAALLAVLIALKLIELVAIAVILLAIAASWLTAGSSLAVIPPVEQLQQTVSRAHDTAKRAVHPALRALRIASKGVRVAMPWIAQARAIYTVQQGYNPPVYVGFAVPARITLPTQDGSYEELCEKAGEYVSELVALPFGFITPAQDFVRTATSSLLEDGSTWFCGTDPNARRPAIKITKETPLPLLPLAKACARYAEENAGDAYDEAEHQRLCDAAIEEAEQAEAQLNDDNGACEARPYVCTTDSLYELRAARALDVCAPRDPDSALSRFIWQERSFKRRYVWGRHGWQVERAIVERSESYILHRDSARPCGTAGAIVGPTWSPLRRDDDGAFIPVCEHGGPPTAPGGAIGTTVDVEIIQALQVFGCLETTITRKELEGTGGELAAPEGSGDKLAPQLFEEGLALGDNALQLRGIAIGRMPASHVSDVLGPIARPDGTLGLGWRIARRLGHFSIAQAEYFFDSADPDTAGYLWEMRWKARLRRFRLPSAEPAPAPSEADRADIAQFGVRDVATTVEAACTLAEVEAGDCESLDLSISDLVVH